MKEFKENQNKSKSTTKIERTKDMRNNNRRKQTKISAKKLLIRVPRQLSSKLLWKKMVQRKLLHLDILRQKKKM